MQVTETLNEGLKRGYRITVPAADLDAKVNAKLTEAQPEVQMKGFRKGKVPMALLRKQLGARLLGEAMQEAVDGAMSSHFEQTGDRPAGQPDVKMTNEDWKEGDDIEVEMTYEALPEIPEVELKTLKVERLRVAPDEASIEDALKNLAETAKTFSEKKGKAKSGDQVVIDFVGKIGGEPFDGGAAEGFPLELGSGSFIPGFEDQIEGLKADDEKVVEVTFPEDYRVETLAGKAATFEVKVKEVKKPELAKVDDDLAKRFGADDLAGLKSKISDQLVAEYSGAARQVMKRRLLDQLDERVNFDLPPSLVDQEAGQIAHQLWHDDNPDHHGHDHDEIEVSDEHRKLAERRVRLGLLLAELGRKAEIRVTDAEMTQAVMTQARQYRGQERQFLEFVQQNAAMRQQIQAPIFEEKVIDYIVELADVSERDVSREELQKEVEALDEM